MVRMGQSAATGWAAEDNARRYDAFARRYPMYRRTSQDLVTLAGLGGNAVVLDLACGTGVTTEAVLAALAPDGRVIGVDKSAAMLAIAGRTITDPRAAWIQADAEVVDQHLTGRVAAVVCNSAIWQTDLAVTAVAVRKVIADGGPFVFNVGAEFLNPGGDRQVVDEQPSLTSVMRDIAARDKDWKPPDAATPGPGRRRLSVESIGRCLSEAGFDLEQVQELSYEESAEAVQAWLSVPVFTERHLPGMAYENRMRVLAEAWQRLEPRAELSRWVAFAARASGNPVPPVTFGGSPASSK